jgi:hypothetical protein
MKVRRQMVVDVDREDGLPDLVKFYHNRRFYWREKYSPDSGLVNNVIRNLEDIYFAWIAVTVLFTAFEFRCLSL